MFSKSRILLTISVCVLVLFAVAIVISKSLDGKNEGAFVGKDIEAFNTGLKALYVEIGPRDCMMRPPPPPCGKGGSAIFDLDDITKLKTSDAKYIHTGFAPRKKEIQSEDMSLGPKDIFIVFAPKGKEMSLTAMSLEVYSGGKLVAKYKLNITGKEKPYKPVEDMGPNVRGYTFALDSTAIKEIEKGFVKGTTFKFSAEVASDRGGNAAFYVVNANSNVGGKQ